MYETIYSAVQAVDDLVWGWAMIILLLGTHIFMTIRTKGIQRKVFKGIKLSVTKDPDAEGEVSQFGALTTALRQPLVQETSSVWERPLPLEDPAQYSGAGLPAYSELPQSTARL